MITGLAIILGFITGILTMLFILKKFTSATFKAGVLAGRSLGMISGVKMATKIFMNKKNEQRVANSN